MTTDCRRVLIAAEDDENEKTMSVLVDNVETLVHFVDVDTASQQVRHFSLQSLALVRFYLTSRLF